MQKKIQSGSFIFHMYRVRLSNITSNYNIIITVDEPNGLRGGGTYHWLLMGDRAMLPPFVFPY